MGAFSFLPKVNHCLFCTRNLTTASILIVIWSMFAAAHSIKIAMFPLCKDNYEEPYSPIYSDLLFFKWFVIIVNLVVIFSACLFLIGIFLSYSITADIFILSGLLSSISMIVFGVYSLFQINFVRCRLYTMNDEVFLFLYSILWIYFIFVIASYSKQMK